jgi:hypothetical protein
MVALLLVVCCYHSKFGTQSLDRFLMSRSPYRIEWHLESEN